MSKSSANSFSIGDVVRATGVGEATLRAWERRYGFPRPRRQPSGHRRYDAEQVEQVRRVLAARARGEALGPAIERALAPRSEVPSLFARLRRRRPELQPMLVSKPHLLRLTRAVETESAARAERALLIGAFQRERYYRQSEPRWRDLVRGGEGAFVFADFDRLRHPRGGATEVPISPADPIAREWGLICHAPEHAACVIGWQAPAERRSAGREFELLFSLEPAVVRETAEAAAEIAAPAAPEVLEMTHSHLERHPDPGPESQLDLSAAITARLVATLG